MNRLDTYHMGRDKVGVPGVVCICFADKLIFKQVNILTRWLHNHTPLEIQTRLHQQGKQMVLLPMNVG